MSRSLSNLLEGLVAFLSNGYDFVRNVTFDLQATVPYTLGAYPMRSSILLILATYITFEGKICI